MTESLQHLDPLQLFEEAPCYISVQSPELKILRANRRFREDFGNAEGHYCWEAYKHRESPCPECQVVKTFEDGLPHTSEEQTKSKNGELINMIVNTSPIRDADGNLSAVMEMSTNITEVQQLQAKLASLGQLVASTAHSIKSIIAGLEGGVYVVNSGFRRKSDEKIKKGWDMVERNIENISGLAMDMLYYSKDRELKKSPFSIRDRADEICELFRQKMKNKFIDFRPDLSERLPQFNGSPKAIRSMLTNILENAIDACVMDSDSNKKHRVDFITRQEDNNIIIETADNGMGMDAETREKVFDLFYTTKESSGTGLGLMVAHKVAREHGGSIDVESAPGEGTKFTIKLPV